MSYKQQLDTLLQSAGNRIHSLALAGVVVALLAAFSITIFAPTKDQAVATRKPHVGGANTTRHQIGQIGTAASTMRLGLIGPEAFSLKAGEISPIYTIRTADGSKVTWELATHAGYWDTITPEKTGAPAFLVVDQPLEQNVSNLLQFHIQAQDTLLPSEYTQYAYAVHITDKSRDISEYYPITFNLAL